VDFNEDILFCHGSPSHPLTEYLLGDVETVQTFEKMRSLGKRCCFVGHSHCTAAFRYNETDGMTEFTPSKDEKFFLGDDLWIFNPGSVGFPRTFNKNSKGERKELDITLEEFPAFYLIFNTDENLVEFKEVRYNAVKTAKKFTSVGTLWY
jgi:diadenosine tetraphosphatase ApaH/serine/threonine PP2A family protein phosphatase